jgi:hypothetical protein
MFLVGGRDPGGLGRCLRSAGPLSFGGVFTMRPQVLLFSALQVADILSTLLFLSLGILEANPLVKTCMRLTGGPLAGLLLVKGVSVLLCLYCAASGRLPLLRRVNWCFAGLLCWNVAAVCL